MTRSPFTVFSALVVACSKASGGCGAAIGKRCTAKTGYEMAHCHTSRRKAADEQRTREVQALAKRAAEEMSDAFRGLIKEPTNLFPFGPRTSIVMDEFSDIAEPIRERLFDNTAPGKPLSSEGLMKLKAALEFSKKIGTTPGYHLDLDPPSYLPMREPLPPRVPDLNPDTQWTGDELAAHDAEKAIDEANWLAQSDAEIATGIVSVDDGTDLEF